MFARYLSCPNGRNIRYRIGKKKKAVMTGRLSYLTEKKRASTIQLNTPQLSLNAFLKVKNLV